VKERPSFLHKILPVHSCERGRPVIKADILERLSTPFAPVVRPTRRAQCQRIVADDDIPRKIPPPLPAEFDSLVAGDQHVLLAEHHMSHQLPGFLPVDHETKKTVGMLVGHDHPSRTLQKHIDFIKPIRAGVLAGSQFASPLVDHEGTFHKPSTW